MTTGEDELDNAEHRFTTSRNQARPRRLSRIRIGD